MREFRVLILTSPHIKGDHVEAMQRALTHAGFYKGPITGEYGPLTAQAAFRAKYRLGYLKPDHSAGDLLYGYLTGQKKPTLQMRLTAKERTPKPVVKTHGALALEFARQFVGITEFPAGSNLNPFGKWYGVNGQPWCAEFVTYCYVNGAKSKAFIRGKDYAYVPFIDADARAGRNNLTIALHPLPGDVICYDWPGESPGVADHTGLFESWISEEAGTFSSIEGNTSTASNSNGGQVQHRQDRNKSLVRTFVRVGA